MLIDDGGSSGGGGGDPASGFGQLRSHDANFRRIVSRLGRGAHGSRRVGVVAALVVAAALLTAQSLVFAPPASAPESRPPVVPSSIWVVGSRIIVAGANAADRTHGLVATSTDGGRTWSSVALSSPPLTGVSSSGQAVIATADCLPVMSDGCVWVSRDGGRSFGAISQVPALAQPRFVEASSAVALTKIPSATVWTTWDGGATWAATTNPCAAPAVAIDVESSTGWTVCEAGAYVGVWGGYAGSSPRLTRQSVAVDGSVRGIATSGDGRGWLWTDTALYSTTDGGVTWSPLPSSDAMRHVVALDAVSRTTVYAVLGDASSSEVARSDDAGVTWTTIVELR